MKSMPLGRMFLLGFDGCTVGPDHWLTEAIIRDRLGGVILFDRNVDGSVQNFSSPMQLQQLTGQLQAIRSDLLLVAVDQEGGRVCRLKERDGFPAFLSAAACGRDEPLSSTGPAAEKMAVTLAENGINLNLAPVVDLDLNPENPIISRYERSYGPLAEQVAAHARIFIETHHRYGIACCLKHFPGHGSSTGDTHLRFVDISDSWQEIELAPYELLLKAGFSDAVMTAHVVHKGLDHSQLPATLSARIITGRLRRELGFDGVVLSDDLQMRAIADHFGYKEAVQLAVIAGVDLMIVGNNLQRREDALTEGITAIEELLDRGIVAEANIQASLTRIKGLKQKIEGKQPWNKGKATARQ